jgi:hypothetical protein
MHTHVITPAAGKRLIGKATASHPAVKEALHNGTVVVIAGTTNGYVAEEILGEIGQSDGFARSRFFRGVTLAPTAATTGTRRLPDQDSFPGDVVIVNGTWQRGHTIFDIADVLKEGDVVIKGANAVDVARRRAAVLIGDPNGGTIALAMQAVVGRRVRLLLPVGLEKRVTTDLDQLAALLNAPGARGPRFFPVPGEVITELDAVTMLTGATAQLVAAGGVCGAEGSIWLAYSGAPEQEAASQSLLRKAAEEPAFAL